MGEPNPGSINSTATPSAANVGRAHARQRIAEYAAAVYSFLLSVPHSGPVAHGWGTREPSTCEACRLMARTEAIMGRYGR